MLFAFSKRDGKVSLTCKTLNNKQNFPSCMEIESILPSPEERTNSHNPEPLQSTTHTHNHSLTDNFNVGSSNSTSHFFFLSISLILLFKCYTCVHLPRSLFYHAVSKLATLNLTLTFSTGPSSTPLTRYTNQLLVWKCCSCVTHFIYKN